MLKFLKVLKKMKMLRKNVSKLVANPGNPGNLEIFKTFTPPAQNGRDNTILPTHGYYPPKTSVFRGGFAETPVKSREIS